MTSNGDAQPNIDIVKTAGVLADLKQPMKARFRALFILRNVNTSESVDAIISVLNDSSALLKHELAYVLGQMQNERAVDSLCKVLDNVDEDPMVRHEAGEALGAIAKPSSLPTLDKHAKDVRPEVSETCTLAAKRIRWLTSGEGTAETDTLSKNLYDSVDPAPPLSMKDTDVELLKSTLCDETLPLWQRYRAMFSLRNLNSEASVLALAAGLTDTTSALFRHEIAYVLGQMQHDACVPHLSVRLADTKENGMVRHECAEALGAIASPPCEYILKKYLNDHDQVVRESCEVALDMVDYEKSGLFQYAKV